MHKQYNSFQINLTITITITTTIAIVIRLQPQTINHKTTNDNSHATEKNIRNSKNVNSNHKIKNFLF